MEEPVFKEKGYYISIPSSFSLPRTLKSVAIKDEKTGDLLFSPYLYSSFISHFQQLKDPLHVHITSKFKVQSQVSLRDYQIDAYKAWCKNSKRGVIVLPTGTGKSFLALKAIQDVGERCLIVVPTLALVDQWFNLIKKKLGLSSEYIGVWIGGKKEKEKDILITTYASAYRDVISLRKGRSLVIFDEVHHLPAESYKIAAEGMFSPYRMGLSATPERADEAHILLDDIVGPQVFRKMPEQFNSEFLSDYEIKTITISMNSEEQTLYNEQKAIFDNFISKHNIRGFGASILQRIIMMSGRNKDARNALKARQKMGQISSNSKNKFIALSKLLQEHRSKKILIFSQSTETVERIGFDFMIPFLTYETDTAERKEILRKFKDGSYSKLVASSVLDEGIDVPDASIGIILTGTSQPRQFIQRLGRILRPYFDEETEQMKQAIMYEIVCKGTAEVSQSRKRKENISKKRGE